MILQEVFRFCLENSQKYSIIHESLTIGSLLLKTAYYHAAHIGGVWRSLVARLTGGQEAAGSSPVTPSLREMAEISHFPYFMPILNEDYDFNKIKTPLQTAFAVHLAMHADSYQAVCY